MKAFLLFTATGAIVILTNCNSIKDPRLIKRLESKSINKFVAHKLPLADVKQLYESHYDTVINNPSETDELRILEYDGERVFNMFSFKILGPATYYEPVKNKPGIKVKTTK